MKKWVVFCLLMILGVSGYWTLERSYFDFSKVDSVRKKVRMLVLHRNGTGEKEAIARMQIASNRLGWECYACSSNPSFWKRHLLRNPIQRVIDAVKPDFTLNFQCKDRFAKGINFVSLASGVHLYFGDEATLDVQKLTAFDGFLPTFQEIDVLRNEVAKLGMSFHGMVWLFTAPSTSYQEVEPKRLFYCGSNWDQTRKGVEYRELFSLLDQRKWVDIYGPRFAWKFLKKNYRGAIAFDGKSLFQKMQEAGIVLILHSDSHIKGNSPTGRIFEAAASSCVIISDLHPFIVKEFGDSVLYIDQKKRPSEIVEQIDAHIDWICQNPVDAKKMALRAHQIFEERFTLERQLIQLYGIYQEIQEEKWIKADL